MKIVINFCLVCSYDLKCFKDFSVCSMQRQGWKGAAIQRKGLYDWHVLWSQEKRKAETSLGFPYLVSDGVFISLRLLKVIYYSDGKWRRWDMKKRQHRFGKYCNLLLRFWPRFDHPAPSESMFEFDNRLHSEQKQPQHRNRKYRRLYMIFIVNFRVLLWSNHVLFIQIREHAEREASIKWRFCQ